MNALGVELVAEIRMERSTEAVDGAERLPQIVRDGVREGLELLIRGLELDRAF